MGDGVNIAARLEGIAKPGAICLSEDAYRQVSGRLDMEVTDLGPTKLKNIEKPIRVYSLEVGKPAQAKPAKASRSIPALDRRAARRGRRRADRDRGRRLDFFGARQPRPAPPHGCALSIVVLPFAESLSGDPSQDYLADGITENLTTISRASPAAS